MKQQVVFSDLGKERPYKEIWDLQEELLQQNVKVKAEVSKSQITNNKSQISNSDSQPSDNKLQTRNSEPETTNYKLQTTNLKPETRNPQPQTTNHLLFVEHNPVYTLGKSGNENHVLINEQQRSEKQIEFFRINRGGDITFHGPGQLVGYPILDLDNFRTDLGWYLRSLEEVIIQTLAEYSVKGGRSAGETGVWIDADVKGKERKICAMGIRCSRWITMHGFALNVNTDLRYFDYIIPCGIQHKKVTSLEKEVGSKVPMDDVKQKVKRNFEKVFDTEIIS
jgi:lipoyl(octanoyl) transferase